MSFARRFDGGNGDDRANALAVDAAGNVTIAGSSMREGGHKSFVTLKYGAR